VVSIHWGANWGYDVPAQHLAFAQRLIGAGIHLVHGHSAHHPLPNEIYRGRLVLYGCGDLIDDYEGIAGYEQYCDDLRRHCCVEPSRDLDAGNSSVRTLQTNGSAVKLSDWGRWETSTGSSRPAVRNIS
jgi:poly-gamma-glutamate capsule biosynthesis protein CapA/YwtB (metallophosphatase superfamily)